MSKSHLVVEWVETGSKEEKRVSIHYSFKKCDVRAGGVAQVVERLLSKKCDVGIREISQ
jgi:hypothetical protein